MSDVIFSSLCLKLRKTDVTNHITMCLKLRMFGVILVPLHLKLGLSGVNHTILPKAEDARCHYLHHCVPEAEDVRCQILTTVSEAEDARCHHSYLCV